MSRSFHSTAEFEAWVHALAGVPRFGAMSRRGTGNLIDAAARARAAQAITTGESTSIARPLHDHENIRADGRPTFALEVFYEDEPRTLLQSQYPPGLRKTSDHVELDCHGCFNTHVDALNHNALDGTFYSGWPVDHDWANGPSIADFATTGLFTRAVYVNVAGHRGTDWIESDRAVTGADIDGALDAAGLRFEPGDALLLDMGRDRYEAAGHEWNTFPSERSEYTPEGRLILPGLSSDGGRWLVEHEASVLCWDMLDAVSPTAVGNVHTLIWAAGLIIVDNCHFEPLRTANGGRSHVAGALVIAPLAIAGGTGCNVNPLVLH